MSLSKKDVLAGLQEELKRVEQELGLLEKKPTKAVGKVKKQPKTTLLKPLQHSPKKVPKALKGEKEEYSDEETKRKEFEEIAREMKEHEIQTLLDSSTVKLAMAKLGLAPGDILPDLLQQKLTIPMSEAVKAHLERRRVEALTSVLLERHVLVREMKARPKTADPFYGATESRALSPEKKREICQAALQKRISKEKRIQAKLRKVQEWDKKQQKEREELRARLEDQLSKSEERAQMLKEERSKHLRAKLEMKQTANSRAKLVQAALENRRKVMWQKKFEQDEQRRIKATLEKSSVSELASLSKQMSCENLSEESVRQLDSFQQREDHRRRVREEAQKKAEQRAKSLLRLQLAKQEQMQRAHQKVEQRIQQQREKRKLADLDRALRLERLHRQEEFRKEIALRKIQRKDELGQSLQELSMELQKTMIAQKRPGTAAL